MLEKAGNSGASQGGSRAQPWKVIPRATLGKAWHFNLFKGQCPVHLYPWIWMVRSKINQEAQKMKAWILRQGKLGCL